MSTNAVPEQIAWRDWDESAFEDAQREEKHVLLTLTATWCHWCHVMDQTTYSDPRVIEVINSRFIPVAVDVDRRPDLSRRYNQGGFPSFVFLTGAGELLTGRIYTPPDQMMGVLESVLSGQAQPAVAQEPPSAAETDTARSDNQEPLQAVLDRLDQLYDQDYGGFGVEPKQPPWEGLRLLLARYGRSGDRELLEQVEKTLTWMRAGIYDFNEQGFFRYSVSRDWKVPHYEKMLVTNANLAMTYLEAFQVTRKRAYRETAEGIISYMMDTLWDPAEELFWSSQDAIEEYYQLPWKDRAGREKPPIDRVFYIGWNALAAETLLKASAVLGRAEYGRCGSQLLQRLWERSWSAEEGVAHVAAERAPGVPVLADQVWFLRAMLTLYQTGGQPRNLERARAIAKTAQDLFSAPGGGFYDVGNVPGAAAGSPEQERSLLENSLLAEALIELHWQTGEDDFLVQARNGLEAFREIVPRRSYLGSHASHRMEEDEERLFLPAGSAWARAWDLLSNGPVHLVVVADSQGAGAQRLWQAAQKIYAPHRITQLLDPSRDKDRITALGFPLDRGPALYACMGGMCLAPIASAAEIRQLERARPWRFQPQSGF